ncbi:hypothetical protein D9M71_598500 [compost metagenome]
MVGDVEQQGQADAVGARGIERRGEFAQGWRFLAGHGDRGQAFEPQTAIGAIDAQAEIGMALQFQQRIGRGLACGRVEPGERLAEDRQLARQQLPVQFDEMRFGGAIEDDPGDQRDGGGDRGEQQAQARGEGRLHGSRSSST